VLVSDEAILDAERTLGHAEGFYAEPAGAAPVAGLREARAAGVVGPDESAVLVVTGNGLKDTESARRAGGDVTGIAPDLADVEAQYPDAS
jgi:threonine synthase